MINTKGMIPFLEIKTITYRLEYRVLIDIDILIHRMLGEGIDKASNAK